MTPYERYIFDDKCPYTNELCYKDIACVNCVANTHEIEDAEKLDRADGIRRASRYFISSFNRTNDKG